MLRRAFVFLSLLAGCGSSSSEPQATPSETGTDSEVDVGTDVAVDTPVVVKPEGTANVTLLTLTAWQGQLEPLTVTTTTTQTTVGGLSTISSYFKAERAATKDDVLFVTAGDDFGATPVLSSAFDDEPTLKALEFLGLRATTFGNHTFDFGVTRLKAIIDGASYKFVTANLTNVGTELGSNVSIPYWMTEVGTAAPKPKVAFIGLTSPDILAIQFPGKLGAVSVEEPIAAGNKAVKAARDAGASLVVALVHEGADSVTGTGAPVGPIVDYVKGISGVDVWVTERSDVKVNTTLNDALVVQNNKRGQSYGVIKVSIVDGKVTTKSATLKDTIGTVLAVLPAGAACTMPGDCASGTCGTDGKCVVSCPSTACPDASFTCTAGACKKVVQTLDPDGEAVLAPYRTALPEKFDKKLAVIDQEYKRGGSPQIERVGETPLGDLVADAVLKRCTPLGAKIALINAGGMKTSLPSPYTPVDKTLRRTAVGYAPGPPYDLVVGDVFNLHPFGNAVVVRKVKGSVLWAALENGFSALPAPIGGFPQIAGFKVVYDPSAAVGSRVVSVTLDDGTVVAKDDTKEIGLATVDFINAGGDGYMMLVEPVPSPTLDLLTTVISEYLSSSSPVPGPTGGRLVRKM
ncbi:MAG: bifunctional metallophosphatase/5'-nucleotidase [Polyangiales bacterium]